MKSFPIDFLTNVFNKNVLPHLCNAVKWFTFEIGGYS